MKRDDTQCWKWDAPTILIIDKGISSHLCTYKCEHTHSYNINILVLDSVSWMVDVLALPLHFDWPTVIIKFKQHQ